MATRAHSPPGARTPTRDIWFAGWTRRSSTSAPVCGISFLARSATVFYSHPDISYVPVTDLAPDQVCLAVAKSRNSPVVDEFFAAAQASAEVTAECGNYEMWLKQPPGPIDADRLVEH